jgi:hypothetical protein
MSTKSNTQKRCGTLKKKIPPKECDEIHIQRQFFANIKALKKLLYQESKQ